MASGYYKVRKLGTRRTSALRSTDFDDANLIRLDEVERTVKHNPG